jgi:hypothetical protein
MTILNDPWVTKSGVGYTVNGTAGTVHVLPNEVLGWGLYAGEHLDLVITSDGPLIGYALVEDAVNTALNLTEVSR